ncbi:MAG: LCP family protein, partial [Oscillospiraceae bacterium]
MKMKSPVRFIIVLLTAIIVIWMCYNFAIALKTGQKFSFFGNNSDEVTNFVVAGVDEDGYRTDLILFCQLDSAKNKLHIMQVPRDTKIQNNRNDKKINSAYFSGIDCLKSEIESVIGLKAEHHVIITFDAFSNLIDALGGVKIDVPIRMKYEDPTQNLNIDLQPGVQVLDGEHA